MSTQPESIEIDEETGGDVAELAAQLELLEVENERLRQELSRTRQVRYRQTAIGLIAVGSLALLGAVLFPVARNVLIALGGTGLFAGVITRYLTPERFVSATVGQRIYESLAADHAALVNELDLHNEHVYVPVETATGSTVRLFIPHRVEYTLPDDEELQSIFVLPAEEAGRGVAFEPTGRALVDELRSTVTGGFADDPERLAAQISDGLVEVFELADNAASDVDPDAERITIAISDSAYGPVNRFDHPIASIVGSALAAELDVAVTLEVTESEDEEYLVTCRWS